MTPPRHAGVFALACRNLVTCAALWSFIPTDMDHAGYTS